MPIVSDLRGPGRANDVRVPAMFQGKFLRFSGSVILVGALAFGCSDDGDGKGSTNDSTGGSNSGSGGSNGGTGGTTPTTGGVSSATGGDVNVTGGSNSGGGTASGGDTGSGGDMGSAGDTGSGGGTSASQECQDYCEAFTATGICGMFFEASGTLTNPFADEADCLTQCDTQTNWDWTCRQEHLANAVNLGDYHCEHAAGISVCPDQ